MMNRFGFLALPAIAVVLAATATAGEGMPAQVGKTAALRRYAAADAPTRETRVLKVQAPIHVDETVKTAPKSRAQIRFADGSIVGMGSDSELVVAKYVYDTKKENGELKVKVKKGFFRILGGAISKKNEIVVETPVATCGIRGSLAMGFYDDVKEVLYIMMLKGELTVEGGGETVSISEAGHGTVVGKGEAPMAGHAFDTGEVHRAADADPGSVASSADPSGGGDGDSSSSSSSGSSGGGCGGCP